MTPVTPNQLKQWEAQGSADYKQARAAGFDSRRAQLTAAVSTLEGRVVYFGITTSMLESLLKVSSEVYHSAYIQEGIARREGIQKASDELGDSIKWDY